VNRAIWALGLRNPFTFAFQPISGRMLINDVGQRTWEEINEGVAGANYGWPATEGLTANPQFVSPLYAYQHGSGSPTGCAISGGAFYNPITQQFPSDYIGDYFFADYCGGWIFRLDVGGPGSTLITPAFATGISFPVDLQVAEDGFIVQWGRAGDVPVVQPQAGSPSGEQATPTSSQRAVARGRTRATSSFRNRSDFMKTAKCPPPSIVTKLFCGARTEFTNSSARLVGVVKSSAP
jgi:Glucose / Sorbosone dehydrogenase